MQIRARLALLAALATALLFGVAGILFARSFADAQVSSLDQGLRAQADTLARRVRDEGAGVDLRSSETTAAVATGEVVAQIVSQGGRVLDSTREAGARRLLDDGALRRARRGVELGEVSISPDRETFRIIARPVTGEPDAPIVIVGTSLEEVDAATARLERGLLIGGLAAIVLAGLGGFLVAGAVLRPVDRMRREAADISVHDSDLRLAVPNTHDELAALATTMNELLARVQEALARQRALVADAGHELRTPLSVLRTELELASHPDRSDVDLRESIAHASGEADRLARLADSLLFLARSDGTVDVRRSDIPIPELFEQVETAWRTRALDEGVELHTTVPHDLHADVDPVLVRRAIDNLLDNAMRHASSRVELRGERFDGSLRISVTDDGEGFSPEFLPHAFERFRRADESRTRSDGGTGLGLAIVETIAAAHGGTARAENGEAGATVSVTVPFRDM